MDGTDLELPVTEIESGALSDDTSQGGEQTIDTGADTGDGQSIEGTGAEGERGGSGQGGQQQPVITGKSVRDAVRSLSEAHPEHAKLLKTLADTHFTVATAYKASFATPRDAQAAKSLIDGLGGVDGATELQQRIAGYDAQESGLESGDPAVLDSFFKDYPDGAAALAPHYLERLASTNPQAFQATVAPYALGLLQQAGVDQHLAALLNETDAGRIKAGIQQLADWFARQNQGLAQIRQQATTKVPGADKIEQERKKLSEERETLFKSNVNQSAASQIIPHLNQTLDKLAKERGLNNSQKQQMYKAIWQSVVADIDADKAHMQQVDLRYANKARQAADIAKYIADDFKRRITDKAESVINSYYPSKRGGGGQQNQGNGVVKAGTPKTAPGGGPIKVAAKPADSELDLNRADAFELMFKQEAWTKAGRHITWRK